MNVRTKTLSVSRFDTNVNNKPLISHWFWNTKIAFFCKQSLIERHKPITQTIFSINVNIKPIVESSRVQCSEGSVVITVFVRDLSYKPPVRLICIFAIICIGKVLAVNATNFVYILLYLKCIIQLLPYNSIKIFK